MVEIRYIGDALWDRIERAVQTSLRDKDKTHLIDMIGLGLIDDTWPPRFKEPLDPLARIDTRPEKRVIL